MDNLYESPPQALLDAARRTASSLRLAAESQPQLFAPEVNAAPGEFFEVWQDNARRFLSDYRPKCDVYRPWPEGLAGCADGHFALTLVGPRLAEHASDMSALIDLLMALLRLTAGEVRMAHPMSWPGHSSIDLAALCDHLAERTVQLSATEVRSVVHHENLCLITLTHKSRSTEDHRSSREVYLPSP
ncbi:hypothetical protein [Lentzea sp. HUAS12]|uniref:hypothetical protein n=1 Tax=Lentzea sp. HUAS12 TaxID=2951806 RepID=UPI00209D78C7|nr:hypothetical protein [Lentzea sp. HUAS12]USX56377.1 hypothetical protein ND450_20420 [Lentzea sp. HUAS12]